MVNAKFRFGAVAGLMTILAACTGEGTSSAGTQPSLYSGPGVQMPPELLACSTGLNAPGCDKQAAGAKLAEMSQSANVLRAFSNPQVGAISMRATADGMRYGVDPVSCGDIVAVPEAFDGAARAGATAELSAFVHTMARDLYAKKGCS